MFFGYAKLFGYQGDEAKDTSLGFETVEDGLDGISSGADKATKAVKDLKKATLGFDELNIISPETETPSTGTGGTGGAGGIDPRILQAMQEYNGLLEKADLKAKSIRDKILEWLGFTIDENGE